MNPSFGLTRAEQSQLQTIPTLQVDLRSKRDRTCGGNALHTTSPWRRPEEAAEEDQSNNEHQEARDDEIASFFNIPAASRMTVNAGGALLKRHWKRQKKKTQEMSIGQIRELFRMDAALGIDRRFDQSLAWPDGSTRSGTLMPEEAQSRATC
jgi:hypothetical protein